MPATMATPATTATLATDDDLRRLAETSKKKLLDRLARAEGQIRGVQKMIVREDECEAIAQQLAAVRSALNKAFYEMMACYFEHKLGDLGSVDEEVNEQLADFVKLLTKYA